MFGFGAISELPLSTLPAVGAVTHTGTATLNASASVSSDPSLEINVASSISAAGTTLNVGALNIAAASLLADTGSVSGSGLLTMVAASTASATATQSATSVMVMVASTSTSASGTVVATPAITIKGVSALSGTATVSADGELTKLGTGSLPTSGTVSAAGELTKLGTAPLSSSVTIAAHPQPLSTGATLSGLATVSGSGTLTKLGTATLSASGTTLNVGIAHISAASLLADTSTVSGKLVGTVVLAGGLSCSATVSGVPTRIIHVDTNAGGSASVSSAGVLEKLGQAHLSNLGAFTSGFSQGFVRGSQVSGSPFLSQNHLAGRATLIANGVVDRVSHSLSLSVNASMATSPSFQHGVFSTLQSIGSLSGNSVLLHGGSINLSSIARLQPRLSTEYDQPDIIALTLYVDRLRSLNGYISKTKDFTGYIDKQLSITSNIDKTSGVTGYIDKVVEKTLVKER